MISLEVVNVEKQKPAGKGRLTGGVTPQGDIEMNRTPIQKPSLKTVRKKAIQNIREIDF